MASKKAFDTFVQQGADFHNGRFLYKRDSYVNNRVPASMYCTGCSTIILQAPVNHLRYTPKGCTCSDKTSRKHIPAMITHNYTLYEVPLLT